MSDIRISGYINRLPDVELRSQLHRCCGSLRWVEAMAAERPYENDAALFAAAERVWWDLGRADWLEAFAQHPRIGTRSGSAWSRQEQAGVHDASDEARRAIRDGNERYERRFGHVFLICATGRSADDMRRELERRLENDAETELRVAAGEQAKITRLRLEKLVTA